MADDHGWITQLATNGSLGWWTQVRLKRQPDSRLLDALLTRLRREAELPAGHPELALLRTSEYCGHHQCLGDLAAAHRAAALAAALQAAAARDGRTWLFWRELPPDHPLVLLQHLLAPGAAAVAAALRLVLQGPPQPALAEFVDAASNPVQAGACSSPKIVALRLLASHWTTADEPLLRQLLTQEETFTAAHAGLAWCRIAGGGVAGEVVTRLLRARLGADYGQAELLAQVLAPLGAAAVAPALGLLTAAEYSQRHRAGCLLVALGEVAVEPLASYWRSCADWRGRQNAEQALTALDPERLRAARREAKSAARGLSLARPDGDPERGLSRVDPAG
ncbi:MAG: hypothetical protein IT204_17260 [Fimbriimonadaceae bacterium]|nr:hypothetical protein [Fimbriimonadaceae bacterium]